MLTDAQLESMLQFPDYADIERLVRELRFYRKGVRIGPRCARFHVRY